LVFTLAFLPSTPVNNLRMFFPPRLDPPPPFFMPPSFEVCPSVCACHFSCVFLHRFCCVLRMFLRLPLFFFLKPGVALPCLFFLLPSPLVTINRCRYRVPFFFSPGGSFGQLKFLTFLIPDVPLCRHFLFGCQSCRMFVRGSKTADNFCTQFAPPAGKILCIPCSKRGE